MNLVKFVTALAAAAAMSAAASAQTVSIGTSPVGSLNHQLGSALGKVLGDEGGLRARVVPFGGGQQFLPMIHAGELEMAVPSSTDALFAYQGQEEYDGRASPGLRAVGTVFPYYIGWFVRKDAPYQTLDDLKGKRIPIGFTANAAQRRVVYATFAAAGLTERDFDGVPVPHVVRGADDFMQGSVEATAFAIGAGKVAEADARVGGIRFLDIPNTPEALAGLKRVMPGAYLAELAPAPGLAGVLKPVSVVFEDYLVIAGQQVSEEVAYKAAKVLYDNQDALAAVQPSFNRYNPNELGRDRGIPFHPGAIKFYREKGIWPGGS